MVNLISPDGSSQHLSTEFVRQSSYRLLFQRNRSTYTFWWNGQGNCFVFLLEFMWVYPIADWVIFGFRFLVFSKRMRTRGNMIFGNDFSARKHKSLRLCANVWSCHYRIIVFVSTYFPRLSLMLHYGPRLLSRQLGYVATWLSRQQVIVATWYLRQLPTSQLVIVIGFFVMWLSIQLDDDST